MQHKLKLNPRWTNLPLFDNKDWPKVFFGDVVQNLNDTESDPKEAGIERFIGLEHLEPGILHVCSWGNVVDGTTFTRRCQMGQVLFGKRRAYQRKVAVTEFDAVVSGDIYVFAPKNDRLLPGILPFLCMSERFVQHAVETSAGSLSPRTNWRHLAQFEFALPPLDLQRRIAKILWEVDEVAEAYRNLLIASQIYLSAIKEEHFAQVEPFRSPLRDAVSNSAYGPRFSSNLYSADGEIAQLRTTDISDDGNINYASIPRVRLKTEDLSSHILEEGDFVISRSGTCGVGAVYRKCGMPTIPGAFLIRLRLNDHLSPEYLQEYVNSSSGRKHMIRLAAGGVQKNIRGSALLAESVPMPKYSIQQQFVETCRDTRAVVLAIDFSIRNTKAVLMDLLNAIWICDQKSLDDRVT